MRPPRGTRGDARPARPRQAWPRSGLSRDGSRDRDHGQPGQQAFGRNEILLVAGTLRAVADVPGQTLAPQRAGPAVPARDAVTQRGAWWHGLKRADHDPGRGELLLHPGHPHRGVLRRQADRRGHLGAVQLTGGFQPPQREQFPVIHVQPAGRFGGLLALAGQAEPEDGQLDEVSLRIGHVAG